MEAYEATLSITEAARALGVHPNTLRAWSDQGRIRSFRINTRGDRRFLPADLEAFLVSAESPAVAQALDADAAPARRNGRRVDGPPAPRDAVGGRPILRVVPQSGAAALHVPEPETLAPAAWSDEADDLVADAVRRELDTAASLLGREMAPSGLDGSLARIARILRARRGHEFVGIWARDGDRLAPRAAAGEWTPIPVSVDGSGLPARALAATEPLAEPIAQDGAAWLSSPPPGMWATAVAIPGTAAPWGVLVAVDRTETASRLAPLPAIAAIVGGAVRTARLVDEATRGRRQSEALRRVAVELASELDLDRILDSILEHAASLFGADRAAVFLGRPGGRILGSYARDLSDTFVASVTTFHPWSLPSQALRERQPVFATRYSDDPRGEFQRDELLAEGIDTICTAPLFDGSDPLGVLNLYHDIAHPWSHEELETLAAFAAQASVAIRNAQNFRRTEAWAAQLQSIQHLGGELGRLSSASEIGTAIVAEIERLIDFHNVRVYLIQGDELIPISLRGKVGEYTDETEDALKLKVGEGITGWVAKHGVPQYLPDAEADARAVTIPGTESIEESMLLAPMVFEEHVLGVIVLSKLGLDQFTDGHLRLLVIFANAAAQAIATAEASEQLRRQSEVLERRLRSQRALLQTTESLLTTLDARAILDGITDSLAELVSYDNLAIELLDPRTGTLRPIVARGVDADYYMLAWEPGEEGLATWVVDHGVPQLVMDEMLDERISQDPTKGPVEGSIICAPLRGPGGVVGVLTLERLGTSSRYDDDDFEVVRLFAGQVSVALRNAEHYRAARVRAETDGLTGLLNYASFRDKLGGISLTGDLFSLLMIDLDGFRAVNAAYKHQGGNVVLRRVAAAIRAAARESDDVFRYGGDEFCILLPRTDAVGATIVAERVREAVAAVEAPVRARGGRGPRITASIGVATMPGDATDADALVDAADRGAFYAKAHGGNRVTSAAESVSIADAFEPTGPGRVESEASAIEELLDEGTAD
jgi:diguanylate cyclase (GGDEF)-like protein/excisionase family DNA binding protein